MATAAANKQTAAVRPQRMRSASFFVKKRNLYSCLLRLLQWASCIQSKRQCAIKQLLSSNCYQTLLALPVNHTAPASFYTQQRAVVFNTWQLCFFVHSFILFRGCRFRCNLITSTQWRGRKVLRDRLFPPRVWDGTCQ